MKKIRIRPPGQETAAQRRRRIHWRRSTLLRIPSTDILISIRSLNAPLTLFWNISRFHPWLYLVAWRGFTPETLKVGSRLPVGGSLTGLTVSRRDIVTTYDLAHNDQLEPRV